MISLSLFLSLSFLHFACGAISVVMNLWVQWLLGFSICFNDADSPFFPLSFVCFTAKTIFGLLKRRKLKAKTKRMKHSLYTLACVVENDFLYFFFGLFSRKEIPFFGRNRFKCFYYWSSLLRFTVILHFHGTEEKPVFYAFAKND